VNGKVAIGTWAYTFGPYEAHPIALDEVVRRLGDLGFDGVELNGFAPHAHPDLYPTRDSRRRLVDLLSTHGLEPAGYAPNFGAVPPTTSRTADYERLFRRYVEFCVDCGIPALRVDTVAEPDAVEVEREERVMDHVARTWRRCAQVAQDAGVLVVWEFEPGFLFNKPSQVLALLDRVDHPGFKALFDSCHAHLCATQASRQAGPPEYLAGGAVEFARLLDGRIGRVHLIDSDNTLHDGATSTHAPFGTGVLDFPAIVAAVVAAGYSDPWWTVDLCFWPDAWGATAAAKDYVTTLLAQVPRDGAGPTATEE
jgi:sugar phosphate isomerase/epimerase